MNALSVGAPQIRGLAWHYLRETWEPRLGPGPWAEMVRQVGGPDHARSEAFAPAPLGPFLDALAALGPRVGLSLEEAQRASGLGVARSWGASYRSLVRRVHGDPGALLGVAAAEVLPWLLDDPRAGHVVDAGASSVIVDLRSALPEAFVAGILEGLALLAGAPEARVARDGDRYTVTWESSLSPPADERLSPQRTWHAVGDIARGIRAPYLAAAFVPALLGAVLAWQDGAFDPGYLGLTLLGLGLLQVGAFAANDYFDHRSRADEANHTPTLFSGGSRLIQRGVLKPGAVLALAIVLLAGGVAVGLHIAFHLQAERGAGLGEVVGLGIAGVALAVLYTAPPARLAHRGLGELAVGLGFGPLIVAGSYFVQRVAGGAAPGVSLEALAFSVPVGALIAAMLWINEVPDAPWDARAGKRTLVVRAGARAADGYALLLVLAYVSLAVAAVAFAAWPALLALATAPLAWRSLRLLRAHAAQPFKLLPANATALVLHLSTGLLLLGGILLGKLAMVP